MAQEGFCFVNEPTSRLRVSIQRKPGMPRQNPIRRQNSPAKRKNARRKAEALSGKLRAKRSGRIAAHDRTYSTLFEHSPVFRTSLRGETAFPSAWERGLATEARALGPGRMFKKRAVCSVVGRDPSRTFRAELSGQGLRFPTRVLPLSRGILPADRILPGHSRFPLYRYAETGRRFVHKTKSLLRHAQEGFSSSIR